MSMNVTRREALTAAAAAATVAAAFPRIARAADTKVTVGIGGTISEAPLYIAEAKGYFKEQGLAVELVMLDSGSKMIPSLGTGQIDVGAGAPSAGLYNAVARGIDVKIVADKGSTPPGYGYAPILVRKSLIDEGKVKSFKDFKGLTVAEVGQGTASFCILVAALKKGGLTYKDVKEVFLSFPDQFPALTSGAIDACISTEPTATQAIDAGVAVRFASSDSVYPNQQLTTLLYGGNFLKAKPELASRFMIAYIKAARFYNDALKNSHYTGPNGAELVEILTQRTNVKDPALYRTMVPSGLNPNGRVNMESLRHDLQTFKDVGFIQGAVTIEGSVDTSIVEAALRQLPPYKPRTT